MKIDDLNGQELDKEVARLIGMQIEPVVRAKPEDFEDKELPLTIYYSQDGEVREGKVTRFGCLPGCTRPTIDITYHDGSKGRSSLDLVCFSREEALKELNGDVNGVYYPNTFKPSTDWEDGGPIIEKYNITIGPNLFGKDYLANLGNTDAYGDTYLIAAMRCLIKHTLLSTKSSKRNKNATRNLSSLSNFP